MYFRDGGHHGFEINRQNEHTRYSVIGRFTNDDGKNYIAEDGPLVDEMSWPGFEKYVQEQINSFFLYADRHRATNNHDRAVGCVEGL